MFKYFLYKFGQFLVNHLPLKVCYRISVFFSDLQYYFSPRDKRSVKNNLRIILPHAKNIDILAREVFENFGKYLADFFRMVKESREEDFFTKNTKTIHPEYLTEAMSLKKGGIILTAHLGNWEVGGMVLSKLGYPFVAIALPHKERPVNDLFNSQREAMGIMVVPTSVAIRRCIEALKKNGLVALLADRDFSQNGEVMDFLGRKAFIPRGPAVFSLKTGAPIIPAFFIREKDDTYRLIFEKPIYPSGRHDSVKDILAIMKKYVVVIEQKIRAYPTQWLMFREFWIP